MSRGLNNDLGCEVAWNSLNLSQVAPEHRSKLSQEIKLLSRLSHPNIVSLIADWTIPGSEELIFITELVTGGSLRSYIQKIRTPRLKVLKLWCKGILQGLLYLHSHGIIHCDLKCDNIYVMANTGDVKIGDFGLSTLKKGTPGLFEDTYDSKVDVYAFGMCVLHMATAQIPYRERNTVQNKTMLNE